MSARAMKRSASLDIPAGVLIEIASDPKRYDEMLVEWDKRRSAAEKAEAQARAAAADRDDAEATATRSFDKLEAAVEKQDVEHARVEASLDRLQNELLAEQANLDERTAALTEREAEVSDRERRGAALSTLVEAERQELAKAAAALDERSAKLTAWETKLRTREGKFRNRLKRFNDGLDDDE